MSPIAQEQPQRQLMQQIGPCLQGKVKSTAQNQDQEQCLVYHTIKEEQIAQVTTLVFKRFKLAMKQKSWESLH